MKYKAEGNPPLDVLDANRWSEFPNLRTRSTYRVLIEGKRNKIINVSARSRQVLEALLEKPVVASSRCRISPVIDKLRQAGFDIHTLMYYLDSGDCFGIYVLQSNVECISKGGV